MSEKLQKVLARAGVASRRQAEVMIKEGRVSVEGKVATLGDRVSSGVSIKVDGREVSSSWQAEDRRVLLYYKPEGEICTRDDPEGRPTVFDHLPKLHRGHWIHVGRLDINSSGLLLFSNDGDLVHRLSHPSHHVEREYAVRVFGHVDIDMVKRLTKGIELEDGHARFEDVVDQGGRGSNHWFHVVIMQGRQRIVRRLWESQGVTVSRLIRVRFGGLALPRHMREGQIFELRDDEISKLLTDR